MSITIKTAEDIAGMRLACRLASEVLDYIAPHIKPGITTLEIDRLGAECMAQQGTISATVGYQPPGYPPYPGSLCTSVNHVVCHGIPNDKPLKKGDIVNVDVTVITKDGWYGDNSRMYLIGECSIAAKRLSAITYDAMWLGIQQVAPARTWATSATPSRNLPKGTASRWCASSAATALARYSTKNPRCCTMAAPARSKSSSPAWCSPSSP
jgi:methionine aminopeptidase type I